MAESIVCGIDDSAGGREALAVAAAFAELLDATLLPVHVLPDDSPFPYGDQAARERERFRVLASIEAIVGDAGDAANGHRQAVHVQVGRPGERLAAVAEERGATMLVVGSRGRGALKRGLLGSVAAELLGISPCPVLVVPPGAVGKPVARRASRRREASVLCGIDGSAGSLAAAAQASGLAARLDKRLVLAHAYRPDTANRAHAEILMQYPGLLLHERRRGLKLLKAAERELTRLPVPELRLRRGEAVRALSRLARREHADVIAVGSRGRGALRSALFGSVSGALAASAPVPVLVVPSRRGENEGPVTSAAGRSASAT